MHGSSAVPFGIEVLEHELRLIIAEEQEHVVQLSIWL